MKKFINLLLIVLVLIFTSCRKDKKILKPWGTWVVRNATMYVTYDNGKKEKYDHFSTTKTVSSLRYDGDVLFDIERIEQNKTTWSFYRPYSNPGAGEFVLNGDTAKHYLVQYTGDNMSIIESDRQPYQQNLGGSARPIHGETKDFENKIIEMVVQEMAASINGRNCHYHTVLTMQQIESW